MQILAAVSVLGAFAFAFAFAIAELVQGRFFPREVTRENNRLDIAVTLLFPLISGAVLAASTALCAWLMPVQRDALASWSWWQMLLVLLVLLVADDLTQYFWHRRSHTSVIRLLRAAHSGIRPWGGPARSCGRCTARTVAPPTWVFVSCTATTRFTMR